MNRCHQIRQKRNDLRILRVHIFAYTAQVFADCSLGQTLHQVGKANSRQQYFTARTICASAKQSADATIASAA